MTGSISSDSTTSVHSDLRMWIGVWLVCLLVPIYTLLHFGKFVIDDAYISFRYARNLAEGHGLVFNNREYVEGYSDFIWTLLMAVPQALGVSVEKFSVWAGAVAAMLALVAAAWLLRILQVHALVAAACSLALALNLDFWTSSTFGLEGGLAAFGIMAVLILARLERNRAAALGGALLFLVRPELLTTFPLLVLATVVTERSWRAGARGKIVGGLVVWVAAISIITACRYGYYGDVLPNTLRAKAVPLTDWPIVAENARRGSAYIVGFLASAPLFAAGFAAAAIASLRRADATVLACILITCFQAVVVLVNAGDWMPNYRLLTVVMPCMMVATGWVLQTVLIRSPGAVPHWRLAMLACVTVVAIGLGSLPRQAFSTTVYPGSACYEFVSRRLRPILGSDDKVAFDALGIGSFTLGDRYAYDMFGLTDRHTALHGEYGRHLGRSDPRHQFYDVRPNVMLIHGGPWQFTLLQRGSDGKFADEYETYDLTAIPGCNNRFMVGFQKSEHDRFWPVFKDLGPKPLDVR